MSGFSGVSGNGHARQNTPYLLFHGGNMGSIPIGRANDFNELMKFVPTVGQRIVALTPPDLSPR
jgi:hypothetical protein